MNTVTAYLLSYGYVVCLVAISVLLMKRKILGEEGARKLIHVMLCVTWVLSMRFDNKIHSIIIPLTFVVINYITIKMQLVPLLYREEGDSYGTVFYPLSFAVMNLAVYFDESFMVPAGVGAFALAFGDGFAAIFGKIDSKYNITLKKGRSLFGTVGCLVFSFLGILIVCRILHAEIPVSWMLVFAVVSTIMEFIGGRFDNLTIPLGVFVVAGIMTRFSLI